MEQNLTGKPSNGGRGTDAQMEVMTAGTGVAGMLFAQMCVFMWVWVWPLPKSFSSVRGSVRNTFVPVSTDTLGLELPSQWLLPLGQWDTEAWGFLSLGSSWVFFISSSSAGRQWCLPPKNEPLQRLCSIWNTPVNIFFAGRDSVLHYISCIWHIVQSRCLLGEYNTA